MSQLSKKTLAVVGDTPPMRPCNLVFKLRRIRCDLSFALDRAADAAIADELAALVLQTDQAIARIELRVA